MSNFLGVISDSKPNSPINQNPSFADLEYFTELLMADTVAMEEDFQRKSQAIIEHEMRLHANIEEIQALELEIRTLKAKDNILEKELCMIFNDVDILDQEFQKIDKNSINYICKCPPPTVPYLSSLITFSGTIEDVRYFVENASSEAVHLNQHNSVFVRTCF